MANTYRFDDIAANIVSDYQFCEQFSFEMFALKAPQIGDSVLTGKREYEVVSVVDSTTTDEKESGFSFCTVTLKQVDWTGWFISRM